MSTATFHLRGNPLHASEILSVADEPGQAIAAILAASRRVTEAESAVAQARAEFRRSIATAYASGVSLTEIGRALGISRQRVKVLRDEAA